MWLGLGRGASCKELNEIIKHRVKIPGPLKGKGIAYTAWVFMMFGIVLQFFSELELSGFSVSEAIGGAGGRSDKVAKVRLEGGVVEADEDVRAEAGGKMLLRVVPE